MGVKRQHTFEVVGPDRFLDQYVASHDYVVGIGRNGVPGKVIDYCDENFPEEDWDWHFKIVGIVESQSSLMNGNVETEGCLSFRNERDAFDFWWWLEQQDFEK